MSKKRCIGNEFKLTLELGVYGMKDIMLDLGSTVNIFLKKYWEHMGKPKLVWPSLQLRLTNQYKIYPISRLENVEVDIDMVKTIANFEVIEIL